MKLLLTRFNTTPEYTIGTLFVDGKRHCFTLEDAEREVFGAPVKDWKVPGKTAIPRGTYKVIVNKSARFKRDLPLVLDVPGFTGIRIHPGNKSDDTEGCILVGKSWEGEDWIGGSRVAFDPLFAKIMAAFLRGDTITLEIA